MIVDAILLLPALSIAAGAGWAGHARITAAQRGCTHPVVGIPTTPTANTTCRLCGAHVTSPGRR